MSRPIFFYGLDHKPISREEADRLLADTTRVVARDELENGYVVSTVFTVVDQNMTPDGGDPDGGDPTPVLYETMVCDPSGVFVDQQRYTVRECAVEGHDDIKAHWEREL